ncbi:MAG: hypothetical protein U9R58_07585 [Chloroflexota bacterium]|nr:hypothetical protein [Chloroflexota bacterium]
MTIKTSVVEGEFFTGSGIESALGGFYRRIKTRHGAAKATVATAHKLARIIYFMLLRRQPYRDPGSDYYEELYRVRVIRNLRRKAAKLDMRLEPIAAT